MTLVVILTIIAFVWLYNRTNLTQVGSNDVVSIYNRVVQKAEIDRQVRGYQLALALGLTDFVRDLGGLGQNEESSLSDYILNLLVVQHQAAELGIRPSDDAVAGAIKSLPSMQTDGAFDPAKYAAFVQEQLAPRGFTERQLEDTVRDSLKVQAVHRIITSPVAVGEAEVRNAARIYQPVTAQVIHFDREKFLKNVSIASEEISAFYEKNKQGLRTSESRSISFVVLELPAAQQKLTGKDRTTALQKLADDAVAAGKSLREEIAKGVDFAKVAEKAVLHPKKLDSIQRDGSSNGKDSGLPEAVVSGAFRLQKRGEVSDIIQDGNSFYIITVNGVSPARQLELAEVTEKITTLLKSEKAGKAAMEAAGKSLEQIRSSMTAGKSFGEAAKLAGVKVEPLMNVNPSDSKNSEEQQGLAAATLGLNVGELGALQPAPWGAFAIYLVKRTPLTDDQWKEHQPALTRKLLGNDQSLLFIEWLNQSRAAAQIKMLGRRAGA